MTPIEVIVASAEEASDFNVEFWMGGEQMALTVLYDGRLHLRIAPAPTARHGCSRPPASRSRSSALRASSPSTDHS